MSFLIPFHLSLRLEGQTHLPHPSLRPFETSMHESARVIKRGNPLSSLDENPGSKYPAKEMVKGQP